jgi:hypothetical protein
VAGEIRKVRQIPGTVSRGSPCIMDAIRTRGRQTVAADARRVSPAHGLGESRPSPLLDQPSLILRERRKEMVVSGFGTPTELGPASQG